MNLRFLLFSLAAALLLFADNGTAGERRTVVFADELFSPFTYGRFGEPAVGGKSLDLLKEVFSRLDMNVEIRLMPWTRAMKTARYGRVDGLPLLSVNESRSEYLVFSEPILESRFVFYYRKGMKISFREDGLPMFRNARIGLVKGYNYGRELLASARKEGYVMIDSPDSKSSMRKLMNGRVDLALDIEVVVDGVFAENPLWKNFVDAAIVPYSRLVWNMGISKRSSLAARIGDINRVLGEMVKDGTLDEILGTRGGRR